MNEGRDAGARRLGRAEKLRLSAAGREAVDAHEKMVERARSGTGRAEFEAAASAWAAPYGLRSEDAPFLVEFADGPKTHQDVARALQMAGSHPTEVKEGILRLLERGLLEPIPTPPPPPPPSYRY